VGSRNGDGCDSMTLGCQPFRSQPALTQSSVMDGEVVGALIALGGAAIGAVGGYLGGWAQAKGTIDGIKLQLAGQRKDALWQAKRDAYAILVQQFNVLRIRIGHVAGMFGLEEVEAVRLARTAGHGTREEELAQLSQAGKECWLAECTFRLSVTPPEAEQAAQVRDALSEAQKALNVWCLARAGGPGDAEVLKANFDEAMATFRDSLDEFVQRAAALLDEHGG
jgi:hypothetical protein